MCEGYHEPQLGFRSWLCFTFELVVWSGDFRSASFIKAFCIIKARRTSFRSPCDRPKKFKDLNHFWLLLQNCIFHITKKTSTQYNSEHWILPQLLAILIIGYWSTRNAILRCKWGAMATHIEPEKKFNKYSGILWSNRNENDLSSL